MITIKATGDTTLFTAGKYCKEDILVQVPEGSGGEPTPTQEKTVNITKNGTTEITPNDGYALSKVTANVSVPIPDDYIKPSGTLIIDENGTHDVTDKASVSVNVPIPEGYIQPSGEIEITKNGQYDVTEKASVNVVVLEPEIVLQEKTVSENGEVTPDSGYAGLSKVVVNVPTGGGGGEDLEAVLTEQEEIIAELTEELQKKTSGETNLGTCTVITNVPSKTNYYICRETVSNGVITYNVTQSYTDAAITQSVRCDSVMYIIAGAIDGAEVTDGEILKLISGQALVYKTPSLNNSIAQITLIG